MMSTYNKYITFMISLFHAKHGITTVLCSLLLLGLHNYGQAQEFLTGNKINPQIYNEALQNPNILKSSKNETSPLLLPFFADFSDYTGYPNENLFIDKQAFVNNTFPVFPPTIGVITLDALNEYGKIYPHLNTVPKGADTITSRFIRLDSLFVDETVREIALADSLYFSFYFQPGGGGVVGTSAGAYVGNQPDKGDSLVLEFGYTRIGDTAVTWNHVWSTQGFNINIWTSDPLTPHQYFKQVMIPITNVNYLCDNFQFRFRNYASLEPQQGISGWEGNVDQWHIDYIRLESNRTITDVYSNDLAFVSPTTSLLKNYQSMPWKQFNAAAVKTNFTNQLTNLSTGTRTSMYQYAITRGENQYGNYSTGVIDIDSYVENGVQNKPDQASPSVRFSLNTLNDTATFAITHIFQNAAGIDIHPQNDTCVFIQKFYNYYAYDDGTAEYGYCLNNEFNTAYLAMKHSLLVPDTLTAVRMWFNHTKNDENADATFTIIVWKDDNGQPDEIIYTLEENKPAFANSFRNFVEYKFDKKILVSGDIWIGFEQKGNTQLNIGFDQNNDSREFFRYNTRGEWETSAFQGTPMLRPVFGDLVILNINETKPSRTTVAPNPTQNNILITNYELRITKVEIFNIMGAKMDEKIGNSETVEMHVADLPTGIYLVKIYKENCPPEVFKLIKN